MNGAHPTKGLSGLAFLFMEQKHIDRFWGFVTKSEGCWIWNGCKDRDGYGFFRYKGKNLRAHRVSYEIHVGEILNGNLICHHCDNPPCVNPEHLFPGTAQDNWDDCVKKQRACWKPDHPFRKNPMLLRHGEKVNTAKLTAEKVVELRKRYQAGPMRYGFVSRLASEFGINRTHLYNIVRGRSWKHIQAPIIL